MQVTDLHGCVSKHGPAEAVLAFETPAARSQACADCVSMTALPAPQAEAREISSVSSHGSTN